jgi:hypothetical protein
MRGKRKAPDAKSGGYYTNYYTNALGKCLFHRSDGAILHVGQDVRVRVHKVIAMLAWPSISETIFGFTFLRSRIVLPKTQNFSICESGRG